MRVVIIGAGAMGSIYGAMFQRTGHMVWMIDQNPAIIDAINAHGLRIKDRDGIEHTYPVRAARDSGAVDGTADLILFQVKGFATAAAANAVRPLAGPSTVILTLQNGLGNEDVLREVFPRNVLILGVSVHSASMNAPGLYSHTGVRDTYLGPADEKHFHHAETLGLALSASGYEAHAVHEADIRRQIFSKWVLNCGSLPVAALTRLATSDLAVNADALDVAAGLTREACMLAALEGYPLDAEERVAFNQELFRTAGGKASMLQDIENGRRTEIGTINGAAIRLAERHGVEVPLNRTVHGLVRALERS